MSGAHALQMPPDTVMLHPSLAANTTRGGQLGESTHWTSHSPPDASNESFSIVSSESSHANPHGGQLAQVLVTAHANHVWLR